MNYSLNYNVNTMHQIGYDVRLYFVIKNIDMKINKQTVRLLVKKIQYSLSLSTIKSLHRNT